MKIKILLILSINVSPCFAQVGLKADNLILSDIAKFNNPIFLIENSGESVDPATPFIEQKPDNSWMITEPLGGILGGALGFLGGALIGGYAAHLLNDKGWGSGDSFSDALGGLFGGAAIGYPLGLGTGIWLTGKCIEKEKGSWPAAVLGALGAEILSYVLLLGCPPLFFVSTIGISLIYYRKTVK